ncbi:MAG: hypothetical protein IT204_17465 [Fimbriimonadaceae bacterium]|nr:hypothetical protein [Fimbriimonadaceae bacterium]
MSDFALRFEWQDPGGIRGAELRATYASLEVLVDGRPLTRVLDLRLKTIRDAVHLPLYPLAEWLVANWWALWHEAPGSRLAEPADYDRRHCWRAAREGYALPPLSIANADSAMQLSWVRELTTQRRLEFVEEGSATVSSAALRETLTAFVETVVGRLGELGLQETPLQADWAAIGALSPEEQEFCEAAGVLGRDPFAMDDAARDELIGVCEQLPEGLRGEFLAAASAAALVPLAAEVAAALQTARAQGCDLSAVPFHDGEIQALAVATLSPWQQGYAAARHVRQRLGLDGQPMATDVQLAEALALPSRLNPTVPSSWQRPFGALQALVGLDQAARPGFAVRAGHTNSVRFRFCRALYEYLAQPTRPCALVTDAATGEQQRNRAFAAELLAPAAGLQELLSGAPVDQDEIDNLAAVFGVSSFVVEHQIRNHRLAPLVYR